jgi:hypothetical protein
MALDDVQYKQEKIKRKDHEGDNVSELETGLRRVWRACCRSTGALLHRAAARGGRVARARINTHNPLPLPRAPAPCRPHPTPPRAGAAGRAGACARVHDGPAVGRAAAALQRPHRQPLHARAARARAAQPRGPAQAAAHSAPGAPRARRAALHTWRACAPHCARRRAVCPSALPACAFPQHTHHTFTHARACRAVAASAACLLPQGLVEGQLAPRASASGSGASVAGSHVRRAPLVPQRPAGSVVNGVPGTPSAARRAPPPPPK